MLQVFGKWSEFHGELSRFRRARTLSQTFYAVIETACCHRDKTTKLNSVKASGDDLVPNKRFVDETFYRRI